MRALVSLLAILILLAGCLQVQVAPGQPLAQSSGPAPAAFRVGCILVDQNGTALGKGTCAYSFGGTAITLDVDSNGTTARNVAAGASGSLTGESPGRIGQRASFVVDGPKSVRLVLPRLAPGARPSVAPVSASASLTPAPNTGALVSLPFTPRHWLPALAIDPAGSGDEPQLAIAPDGTIYYSPLSTVYASTDGGSSFHDVTPAPPLELASDTAIQVAPDGSVWFTDDWPYAGHTQACRSADQGQSWTCDRAALPGATDRMWIAGKSANEGYLQTGQALEQPNWLRTTTGSLAYVPYATGVLGQYGNIVYDQAHDVFWQISGGDPQAIARIDVAGPTVSFIATTVPGTYAIAWLAVSNGTLWTTGEKDGKVLAARSTDEGKTWKTFPVSQEPAEATFSYVAAGPAGRAAVVYYGSDKAGPSTANGGHWSLYVAETDNALDAQPTWVETRIVDDIHTGNLCIGATCEQGGGDANARMAGDLIGIAIDADGNVHVAYVRDAHGSFPAEYMRQVRTVLP